jgi:hypothetical protein
VVGASRLGNEDDGKNDGQKWKTFFKITGIPYIGNDTFAKIISVWNISGFTNREKTFIFKFKTIF